MAIWPAGPPKLSAAIRAQTFAAPPSVGIVGRGRDEDCTHTLLQPRKKQLWSGFLDGGAVFSAGRPAQARIALVYSRSGATSTVRPFSVFGSDRSTQT